MVTAAKIQWGSYQSYSGPFYWGKHKWKLPADHDTMDELVFVMSSSEGNLDAMNLYDRCILSGGAIGWCDAWPQISYTKLLGLVADQHPDAGYIGRTLRPALDASGASFKKNASGQWRFFIGSQEVNSQDLQRKLYFAGSSGKTGDWTAEQKERAKLWAACCATVFEDPHAQRIQIEYTKPKMMGFVTAYAKEILFDDKDPKLVGADPLLVKSLRAIYVSFAGNNPTWASAAIKNAALRSKHDKWTRGWCVDVLHDLTFLKGIKIYPERYAKVVAVTEKLYAVGLPVDAQALKDEMAAPDQVLEAEAPTGPGPVDTTPVVDEPVAIEEVAPTAPEEAPLEETSNDETPSDDAPSTAIEPTAKKTETPLERLLANVIAFIRIIVAILTKKR